MCCSLGFTNIIFLLGMLSSKQDFSFSYKRIFKLVFCVVFCYIEVAVSMVSRWPLELLFSTWHLTQKSLLLNSTLVLNITFRPLLLLFPLLSLFFFNLLSGLKYSQRLKSKSMTPSETKRLIPHQLNELLQQLCKTQKSYSCISFMQQIFIQYQLFKFRDRHWGNFFFF